MSSWKLRLARVAARAEYAVERLFRQPRAVRVIEPYVGYATPDHLILRGRVLAASTAQMTRDGQSRLRNARQMLRLFATQEVADVTVSAGDVTALSDAEGYFTLLLPRDAYDATGWITIPVSAQDVVADCPVMIPSAAAEYAVVSDVDDTMMQTGAFSLWRNLWTSLTGNAMTRHVFPDAIRLMAVLGDGGRNPVYFVSSSPWNFHGFLSDVFARNNLPAAPMFLRDYGISETQLITGTHGDHKGSAIDRLMAAHPDLDFVLIGDTGQHDPAVYEAAVARHPNRVRQVILRTAGGLDASDQRHIDAIRTAGVAVSVGESYDAAIALFGTERAATPVL